jgi:hypothetical protein
MSTSNAPPAVTIEFDCTPLRSVPRLDIPLDASPGYRARLERFQQAIARHGTRNTYYLTNAACMFRLTNDPDSGWVRFAVEGTVITDDTDAKTVGSDLDIRLDTETCDWLTQPAVEWLAQRSMRWRSSLIATSLRAISRGRSNGWPRSRPTAMPRGDFWG